MESGQGGEEKAVLDLDDPQLEEKLVSELKAQGVFDQFRKDCLSDVDTKPAYQNLRVRVDKSVSAYLDRTTWRSTLNKNQLRNQLRKYIQEMSGVEAGVDRIVDQIVNPDAMEKEVESVIYRYFGTSKEVEEAKEQEAMASNGGVLMEEEEDEDESKPAAVNGEVAEHKEEGAMETAPDAVEEFSHTSSPGPDMAAVSPLTPQDSPTVPQGDISPITPKQSPSENMEVDSPPRPPSAYTPPPRPAEGFTPPLPPTQILGLGASPPKAPTALQPPPPPPPPAASDSGGEASMSSISDTDLGEVSPPQPRRNIPEIPANVPLPPSPSTPPAPAPPPSATPPPPGEASGSEESDLGDLERMKAELLAQLEGDFKISPEESESGGGEGEEVKGTEKAAGSEKESGSTERESRSRPSPFSAAAATMSPRSPSASPSPPPPTHRLSMSSSPPGAALPKQGPMISPPGAPPPDAAMEAMTLKGPTTPPTATGCQPFSEKGRGSSGSSPDDEGGRGRGREHLSIPLPPLPPPPANTQASSSVAQGSSSGTEGDQKRTVLHSSSTSSTSSTSSSSSSSSTPTSSKHRDRKYDRKHEKAIKEKEKAKIEKYDQKVKSKDKLKSDKFQGLDIFSKTKTPVTPYQPHRPPHKSLGKNDTPVRDSDKKIDEKVTKDFKTPGKVEDRRRSSSSSDKGREKERHSSSSSSHSSSKDRHRHDKERRHSKDGERRHSKDEKRSSEKEERKPEREDKKSAEELKRAGDKERERLLKLYSSELALEEEKREGGKDKYGKEREQQALESKKRLQESRERKEKEVRELKEQKRLKDKERREKERKLEKEREAKEEKARKERLEENKNAVKEKIEALKPEELKMVLLESIVAKEGGNLDETQRKDVLRTLESAIVGKVVEKKVKSPGKNGRRSRLKGDDSSDEDFTPSKAKKMPSRKRVASDSESDSGSDSDSYSGIKALKTRIAERRKSTEELISRKSPDTSTTSLRRSIDDTSASSAKTSQLQCEASPKPSKKTKSDQTKVPSPKSATQPVQPVKTKSSPIKAQSSPGKSQKSPQQSPSKTKRLSKPMTSKKQLASGSKKPINPKSKAAMVDFSDDDDPDVEPFEAFKQSDIDFMLRMKDLYGLKLEKGIDALSISSVTSTELNLAIPVSRMVTIDVDEKGADNLVHNLANYGGNPRIFSAVPDWLAPHLEASRVKEEVEMPTKQEIANHLAKKNKTSKRKAGWDIVVEVVPTGPQPKKSKLEIQLGYDSSFADSLTLSGGRRSRRPNKKYTYGGDESTQSETSIDSSFDMATPQQECTAPKEPKMMEPEIGTKEEKLDVSEAKMEVGEEEVKLSIGQVDQSCSSVETLEIAEAENEISVESESSSGESLKLFLVDTSDDVDAEIKETSDDAEIGNKDEEVVKEESREEKKVSFAEDVSNTSQPSELSHEEGKNVCVPKPKELQSSTTETNRKVKEEKPNGTLRELRKRRGGAQKNSTESNCISADEGDFYGWASAPPPPRTGWQLLGIELEEEVILEKVGAAFGLDTEDILLPVKDQERSLTMEVVMSPPMIQDTKRVEREESTGITKKVAFPESDQEERGSQSPSSFGSLKENVPLQCNNNAPLQKQKGGSKRRRSTRDPVLKTNTVV